MNIEIKVKVNIEIKVGVDIEIEVELDILRIENWYTSKYKSSFNKLR